MRQAIRFGSQCKDSESQFYVSQIQIQQCEDGSIETEISLERNDGKNNRRGEVEVYTLPDEADSVSEWTVLEY